MPRSSNTVDQARTLLERRLKELDDERRQVQSALAGLSGRRRGPGRPPGSGGRRRRRGGRADQAVKIITDNPGINASDLARKMRLKAPNYLYRVLPDLQKDGRIRKRGKGYFPG
jgi:hypothetical protein